MEFTENNPTKPNQTNV